MKHRWKLDEYGKPDEWAWESGFHNRIAEAIARTEKYIKR
jgi:hypothetical protein